MDFAILRRCIIFHHREFHVKNNAQISEIEGVLFQMPWHTRGLDRRRQPQRAPGLVAGHPSLPLFCALGVLGVLGVLCAVEHLKGIPRLDGRAPAWGLATTYE